MKRILTVALVVAAIAPAGMALPVHALTPTQSAALAAKARAEALARTRAQAAAKARADSLAKSRADAAAKSRALATATQNIRAETRRRTEAAEQAAKAQTQIKTANIQSQPPKTAAIPRSTPDLKPQVPNRVQAQPAQALRSTARPQHAHVSNQHSSMNRAAAQASKSPAHHH